MSALSVMGMRFAARFANLPVRACAVKDLTRKVTTAFQTNGTSIVITGGILFGLVDGGISGFEGFKKMRREMQEKKEELTYLEKKINRMQLRCERLKAEYYSH